jgi:predicted dehydrogenase
VRTVIVGCGAIADRWCRVLTADHRVSVVAFVDTDLDRAARLAARRCSGVAVAVAASLDQARAATDVDLVVNLSPPDSHAAVSRAALCGGLHVLTEKPLALRLADAIQLAELAQAQRRTLAVMHNRGRDPQFLSFADQVTTAGRGPLAVTTDVLVDLHEPGFRADQRLPVTTDLAVHAFDQIQALITADPIQVEAIERPLAFLGDHCGLATITVTFADDSVLCYRGGYTRRGLATSALGVWRVDGPDLAARWQPPDEPSHTRPPTYRLCIADMLNTVQAVQAGALPPWPALAVRSVSMLEAAVAAAADRRPIAVSHATGGRP